MDLGKKGLRFLPWLGVALLQFIMTQVVTLVFSFVIPNSENFPQTHSALFVAFLGVTFTTGVFLTGWLALKWRWLRTKPMYRARLLATLVGAYLPLILALILYRTLEPGNPFFFVSMMASILGFHVPSWVEKA